MRAAGPSRLPTAALPAADIRSSELVDAELLLVESSGGAAGLVRGAASLGGSTQGACGTITTVWREGFGASVDAEVFASRARRTGEVGKQSGVCPTLSAAAKALPSAPAANAGCSGDSRLITPRGVSGSGGPPSAVARPWAAIRSRGSRRRADGPRWTAVRGGLGRCDAAR